MTVSNISSAVRVTTLHKGYGDGTEECYQDNQVSKTASI